MPVARLNLGRPTCVVLANSTPCSSARCNAAATGAFDNPPQQPSALCRPCVTNTLHVQVPTYDASWYKAIKRPTWTPPNWVFPAVWIPLKVMQSVSHLDGMHVPEANGVGTSKRPQLAAMHAEYQAQTHSLCVLLGCRLIQRIAGQGHVAQCGPAILSGR